MPEFPIDYAEHYSDMTVTDAVEQYLFSRTVYPVICDGDELAIMRDRAIFETRYAETFGSVTL